MSDEKCQKSIWDDTRWVSAPCGRPVKEEGLCGIHLRQKRKKEEKAKEFDDRERRDRETEERVVSTLKELGIEGGLEYSYYRRPTGNAVVSLGALRAALAEAWDECHTATCPDLGDWRHACVNPYEEGATDE